MSSTPPEAVTRILPGGDPAAIAEAAARIRAGDLVAFPTETVYGLGANAFDPVAVARVFEAKGRPTFDPLIVHVADRAQVANVVDPGALRDPRFGLLADRFWPGPLTLVVAKTARVPGIVTAGLDTVGVRMPDHPAARALIRASGVPIAAPSANRFGRVSPTRADRVVRQLGGRVGLILDGGPSRVGVESTVLLLAPGLAALLRAGGVALEALEAVVGAVTVPADDEAASLSPGRSGAHYAPEARVLLAVPDAPIRPGPGERLGLLAASDAGRARAEAIGGPFAAVEVLAPDGDPVLAAATLFEAIHRLDEAGVDAIIAQPVAETGLGRAVMDRLRRAAGGGHDGDPTSPQLGDRRP